MRKLVAVVSLVVLIGSLRQTTAQEIEIKAATTPNIEGTSTPDRAALDRMIDRIIAREHYEYIFLSYIHPILETRIQEEKWRGNEEIPWRQWDLRGRATLTADLSVHSTLKKNPDVGYDQRGFLQEAFVDRTALDRQHYSFRYVGQEEIEGVHCVVFDIAPLGPKPAGRFLGRIWANDGDYTIIRFRGTYMRMHHWELVPTPVRTNVIFANFDSRRSSAAPGVWLPSSVLSQRSNLSEGRTHWDFNSETLFSGYNAAEMRDPKIPAYNQQAFQKPVLLPHHLGKAFWIPWSVNLGFMMTSNALTSRCLRAHQCLEGDPIFGKYPSPAEIYSVRIALFVGGFVTARKGKLRGDDTWWHFDTYFPMMGYGYDFYHDLEGTFEHLGQKSPAAARREARARLMSVVPAQSR